MGAPIRYKVPYRVTVTARDLGSTKSLSNSWYFRTGTQQVAPPAYGGVIAGSGDTEVFIEEFRTAFANVRALLNHNYSTLDYICSALIGKRYKTPVNAIASLTIFGGYLQISTGVPHGLVTGDPVFIGNVTIPASANGVYNVTTVNTTTFTIPVPGAAGPWSGDGFWQEATGDKEFILADTTVVPHTDVGGIAGDALPLFATASIRRLNAGTGRNFRSRASLSPMSEADSLDGGWTTAAKTAWAAGLSDYLISLMDNGGSDSGSRFMADIAVSQSIAMSLASPFTQSDTWTSLLTGLALQPNAGSLVRRKPKLTSPIT